MTHGSAQVFQHFALGLVNILREELVSEEVFWDGEEVILVVRIGLENIGVWEFLVTSVTEIGYLGLQEHRPKDVVQTGEAPEDKKFGLIIVILRQRDDSVPATGRVCRVY